MFYCKRYSSSCLVSIFWIARTKEQYQQRFLALALTQYRFLAFSLPRLFAHLLLTFEFAFTLLHSRALHCFITQRENASGPIRTLPILINNQFKKVERPWRPYEGEDTMKEIRVLYITGKWQEQKERPLYIEFAIYFNVKIYSSMF